MSPFQILGVSEQASDEEIKSAYRRLAIQYHPDRNPGDPTAEARFKEVQSAYEQIKDQESRQKLTNEFNPFETLFSHFTRFTSPDVLAEVRLSFTQPRESFSQEVTFTRKVSCQSCQGSGAKRFSETHCRTCRGSGKIFDWAGFIQLGRSCQACSGRGRLVLESCLSCQGGGFETRTETLSVTIPAGISDGQILTFSGYGNLEQNLTGNLNLVVRIDSDPRWTREGSHVFSSVKVTYPQLVLGAQLSVETIWGTTESIQIPPGTSLEEPIKIPRKGFPQLNRVYSETALERGDHYCFLKLEVPTQISDEYRALLAALQKLI